MNGNFGAIIQSGPSDWQIIQRDSNGLADIPLGGLWIMPDPKRKIADVEVRLVGEQTGAPVAPHLDWAPASVSKAGTWSHVLRRVPAGGLYRIETRITTDEQAGMWGVRGDIRHFIGVGDLWVIAGQSNSAGYGVGLASDGPELGVHLFNNAMRWAIAAHPLNDSTDTAHTANREGVNPWHSPWLHWARRIKQELHVPIGLVQASLGGSPLASWNPTEEGDHPLYETMVRVIQAAGGKVRGVLWYQGCSDSSKGATYQKRFVAMVKAWRKALRLPRLYMLTVQLNRGLGQDKGKDVGWTMLREAQRQAPRKLRHCCVIPTLDLPLCDTVHNSPSANLLLAERAALAALGDAYGKDLRWRAPEIADAKAARDGKSIDLRFDYVHRVIGSTDMAVVPFKVEDRQGAVPIEKMQCPPGKSDTIRLVLSRPIAGKAVVHGAFGQNPVTALYSFENMMPMLGFYAFPVSPGR